MNQLEVFVSIRGLISSIWVRAMLDLVIKTWSSYGLTAALQFVPALCPHGWGVREMWLMFITNTDNVRRRDTGLLLRGTVIIPGYLLVDNL